jgi:hypothetical protein
MHRLSRFASVAAFSRSARDVCNEAMRKHTARLACQAGGDESILKLA